MADVREHLSFAVGEIGRILEQLEKDTGQRISSVGFAEFDFGGAKGVFVGLDDGLRHAVRWIDVKRAKYMGLYEEDRT